MKYILLTAAFFIGTLLAPFINPSEPIKPINTVQTIYVSTPVEGELLVREMYATLLNHCRTMIWKKDPFVERPPCETIAMVAVAELLVNGSVEGRSAPVQ